MTPLKQQNSIIPFVPSVPNFNFLAPSVTGIWRDPKIVAADLLRRALAGKLLGRLPKVDLIV